MRKLLFSALLILSILSVKAQQGFTNLTDYNPLTNPWWAFNESVYWLRGSTPQGTVRILTQRGTWQTRIHTDSVLIPKLSLREDANPYKLVWIGQDSLLRAFTPNYLTSINSSMVTTALGYTPINPNGSASQYFKGDGSLATFPTIPAAQVNSDWSAVSGLAQILNKPTLKKVETFLGTTDGSGNYTVTYGVAYAVIPDVQPQLQAGTPSQVVRITASSTTGFTVQVTNRASVNLLGIDVLLATTTPVSGASVGVLVTSR